LIPHYVVKKAYTYDDLQAGDKEHLEGQAISAQKAQKNGR